MKFKTLVFCLTLLLAVVGCQLKEKEPTPTVEIVAQLSPPVILPTATLMPAETAVPTNTSTPSPTDTPTPSPASTFTPRPTPINFEAAVQAGNATWQIAGCFPAPIYLDENGEVLNVGMTWAKVIHIIPDQYLFLLHIGRIYVLDISDPANPHEVYVFKPEVAIHYTAVFGNTAYVLPANPPYGQAPTEANHPYLLDISDPTSFRIGRKIYNQAGSASIKVTEKFIYLTSYIYEDYETAGTNKYLIILTNTAEPQLVAKYSENVSLFILGNFLYSINSPAGVSIYDISDPAKLQFVNQTPSWNGWIRIIIENWAYFFNNHRLQIWDFSNLTEPLEVNTIEVIGYPGNWAPNMDMVVEGNYLYLTQGVLRILDISDRANPQLIAAPVLYEENPFICDPTEFAVYDLATSGQYIYIVAANYLTILERIG